MNFLLKKNIKKIIQKRTTNIILGSSSPRRIDIFNKLGIKFKIIKPNINESLDNIQNVKPFLKNIVTKKYNEIKKNAAKDSLIFCFDTIVLYNKIIYGKPKNKKDAFRMLKNLSGKKHKVLTACAAGLCNKFYYKIFCTQVYFKKYSDNEIKIYLNKEEYKDAAGAYKIQENGLSLVKKIRGSYYNIVGLPIEFIRDFL